MSAVYLLNGSYMPYYKWMFRGAEGFDILSDAVTMLRGITLIPDTPENQKLLESGHYTATASERKASDKQLADRRAFDRRDLDKRDQDEEKPLTERSDADDLNGKEGGDQHA